jgi:hypothetical protein
MENSLLELHHLRHDKFDWSRPVKPMGIVEVDSLDAEDVQAPVHSFGHVSSVAAETEAVRQLHSTELGGEEEVLPLLWVQSEPLANDGLYVSLVSDDG